MPAAGMTRRIPLKVVVVDDEPLVRAGLRALLEEAPDITVVGEAADGAQAVELVVRSHPDVVLMDVRMPNVNGLEATRRLRASHSRARVLVVTTADDDAYVVEALRAGASGFLLKDTAPARLADAVRTLARDEEVLDPTVTRRLIERQMARPTLRPEIQQCIDALGERELRILQLLSRGMSNAEISEELVVSEATAKSNVTRLLAKLGVRSRVQAVVLAYESGKVQPGHAGAHA